MTRAVSAAVACALALTVGCGSDDTPIPAGVDKNDKRAVALACITGEQGLEARLSGDKAIQVDGRDGARVEFLLSSGEAEGRQFLGGAQGAEQIGSALLFVNASSEEDLKKIESCLEEQ